MVGLVVVVAVLALLGVCVFVRRGCADESICFPAEVKVSLLGGLFLRDEVRLGVGFFGSMSLLVGPVTRGVGGGLTG